MYVLRKIYEGYDYAFNLHNDPRLEGFYLMGSPFPILLILGLYFWFVIDGGKRFMQKRPAFQLNNVMMIYNLLQVILNFLLMIYMYYHSYWQDFYSFKCQPFYYGNDQRILKSEFMVTYFYFLMKILDLFDTIFMVLRKKQSHVSFLHLYHHIGMSFGSYCAARFFPGGHHILLGIVNSFVHSVMYFYYFLTSFKPELKESIWWKKHITQIQMVQFTYMIFHFGRPLLLYPDCQYPTVFLWLLVLQATFMNFLFGDFYYKAYIKPNKQKNL